MCRKHTRTHTGRQKDRQGDRQADRQWQRGGQTRRPPLCQAEEQQQQLHPTHMRVEESLSLYVCVCVFICVCERVIYALMTAFALAFVCLSAN